MVPSARVLVAGLPERVCCQWTVGLGGPQSLSDYCYLTRVSCLWEGSTTCRPGGGERERERRILKVTLVGVELEMFLRNLNQLTILELCLSSVCSSTYLSTCEYSDDVRGRDKIRCFRVQLSILVTKLG